jgi:succinate dehydrogenase hydrophobic anchor subunit
MDEYVHRWMISYGWISFYMDEFHLWVGLNKSLDEIHPWLEDKYILFNLYLASFVVQVLIFQTW